MRFRTYVTDTLAPVLKRGDTVILANLNAHKVAGVREAIEAVGARVLYLPPYSSDPNPIEQVSAKVKALLRTVAARTAADLTTAIEDAFAAVRPDECRSYLTLPDTMPLGQPETERLWLNLADGRGSGRFRVL